MRKLRRLLAVVLSLSMVFSLAGCSSSGETTAAGNSTTAASEAGSEMVENAVETVGAEDCVIGLSIISVAAEFW